MVRREGSVASGALSTTSADLTGVMTFHFSVSEPLAKGGSVRVRRDGQESTQTFEVRIDQVQLEQVRPLRYPLPQGRPAELIRYPTGHGKIIA